MILTLPSAGARTWPVGRVIEGCWLVALFLAPLLFNPWSDEGFDNARVLLILGCAGVALFGLIVREHYVWGRPLGVSVGLVLFSYLLATLFSKSPLVSWKGNYVKGDLGGTLLVLAYAVIGLAIACELRTEAQKLRLCAAVAGSAVLASGYAFAQALHFDFVEWTSPAIGWLIDPITGLRTSVDYISHQPSATFGTTNALAFFLVLALPFVAYLVRVRREWCVAGAIILGGIVLSGSRGALLGLGVEALLLMWWRKVPLPVMMVMVLMVGGVLGIVSAHGDRMASVRQRLTVWQDVSGLVVEKPVLGYGPFTLGSVYTRQDTAVDGTRWERSHNRVLDTLADRGLVGLGADLLLCLAAWWLALRRRTAAAKVALAVVLAGWAVAMFDVTPVAAWLLQWAALGMIAAGEPA